MVLPVSNTFHGRDIFTPVAANIINGVPFEEIGPLATNYINLNLEDSVITEKTATGKIISIDDFGNIITDINNRSLSRFLNYGKKIMVFIGKKNYEIPFVKTYNFIEKGKLLATIGSSNYFEISLNQGNAAEKLKVKPDDEIKILYN